MSGSCPPRFVSGSTKTRKRTERGQGEEFCLRPHYILVVTFAELLGVSDGGPDDHSRDSFVGAGRGLDILIPAPAMEKGFPLIPPDT